MEALLSNAGISEITHLTQFLKNRLYFATIAGKTPKSTPDAFFFTIDDELVYHNYYSDFGPLNLSCLFKYCNIVNNKLKANKGKKIIHYTSTDLNKRANAAFLISSYAVLYLAQSPSEAFYTAKYRGKPFKPFQDASQKDSSYHISILDCLQALHRAVTLRFFNFMDFDCAEFDKLSKVSFGDISWIVPGKFVAFPGPVDTPIQDQNTELYIKYFLKNNVTAVIRLNRAQYDAQKFIDAGISHFDLFFPDGTTPPRHILVDFLHIVENEPGAIAVHCKAGLGRTGTLIAAYLIKHYDMGARESIAWLRLCRPGCVIGPQQGWLEQVEGWLWKEGCSFRIMMHGEGDKLPCHRYGIYSMAKKKRSSIRSDEARISTVIQEKRQLLKNQSNELTSNKKLISMECPMQNLSQNSEETGDKNDENTLVMETKSVTEMTSEIKETNNQGAAKPLIQLYERNTEKIVNQTPIIVMPAILSVKQKPIPDGRPKYLAVSNTSENRSSYAKTNDGKERNAHLKKFGSPAKQRADVVSERKQNSETQGQRLWDLKKEREKIYYRNRAVADIRLLSQSSMPNRHKGHK